MIRSATGIRVLGALALGAVALVALELATGALSYGSLGTKDPCTTRSSFPGTGFDASVQRIALSGLYGAACELGTSREELVLSFVPSAAATEIRWDRATIERAVRAGLMRSIDDAEARGSIGGLTARVLRAVAERAPVDWLLDRADDVSALIDTTRKLADRVGQLDLDAIPHELPDDLRSLLDELRSSLDSLRERLPGSLDELLQQLGDLLRREPSA